MAFSFIVAPIVGGVIGYVTNDIAIACCSARIRNSTDLN